MILTGCVRVTPVTLGDANQTTLRLRYIYQKYLKSVSPPFQSPSKFPLPEPKSLSPTSEELEDWMRFAVSFPSLWDGTSRFIGGFSGFFRRFLGFCGWRDWGFLIYPHLISAVFWEACWCKKILDRISDWVTVVPGEHDLMVSQEPNLAPTSEKIRMLRTPQVERKGWRKKMSKLKLKFRLFRDR